MFKLLGKILLKTSPPAESSVFQLLAQDDLPTPSSKLIVEAGGLISDLSLATEIKAKGKLMWECDVFIRYCLIKCECLARRFNESVKSSVYGEQEVHLQTIITECLCILLEVLNKSKNQAKCTTSLSELHLPLPSLSELSMTTSTMRLLFFLFKIKEHFNLTLHGDLNNQHSADRLLQTNNLASVLEDESQTVDFGQKMSPDAFQYHRYELEEQKIFNFENIEYNGNSYISIVKAFKESNIELKEEKTAEFNRVVTKYTIYQALKKGVEQSQYIIVFLEQFNGPAFQYRWLEAKPHLSKDVNDHIQNNLSRPSILYPSSISQEYFQTQLSKEHNWIINYSISDNKFYTNQYRDHLVRNTNIYHFISARNLDQSNFKKYSFLMSKVYEMLDHILQNPELYDDFKFNDAFGELSFSFNQKECMRLWEKLKASKPMHKNISRLAHSFITHVFLDIIEKNSTKSPDWKSELLKQNKTLLIKIFRANIKGLTYVESDLEMYKELLALPEFVIHEHNIEGFVEYFYGKGLFQQQIKEYTKRNIYLYANRNNWFQMKILTLQEKMDCMVQKFQEFRKQKKEVLDLRNKYGVTNKQLDRCLFENFQAYMNFLLCKINKAATNFQKEPETQFDDYITRLREVSQDTSNVWGQFAYEEVKYPNSISVVVKILETITNSQCVQIFRTILQSQVSIVNLRYSGLFSDEAIRNFLSLQLVAKIGDQLIEQKYDQPQEILIPQHLIPSIRKSFSTLISLISQIGYINIDSYIKKQLSKVGESENKVDMMVEITSDIMCWYNISQVEQKKKPFESSVSSLISALYNIISVNIPVIQDIVDQIFIERIEREEISVQKEGTDYEIFQSMMKEIMKVYPWGRNNIRAKSWIMKHQRINSIMERVKDVAREDDKYFLVNHFFTTYQESTSYDKDCFLQQYLVNDGQFEEFLDIIYNSYRMSGFANLFESGALEQFKKTLQSVMRRSQKTKKLLLSEKNEKRRNKLLKQCTNLTPAPLQKFIRRVYENIHELESSTVNSFINQAKDMFPELQKYIHNSMMKYLFQKQHVNELKQVEVNLQELSGISFDINNFEAAFNTLAGKLNTFLIVQRCFGLEVKRVCRNIMFSAELETFKYSEEILKPINYLNLEDKKDLQKLYRSKIDQLIVNPVSNIVKDKLILILEITLYIQANITMYHPGEVGYYQQFLSQILSIYNTKNQLGDISKYIILDSITPLSYEYNLRQMVLFISKRMARNFYHPLALIGNQVDLKELTVVFDQHFDHLLQQLPPPYSRSNLLGEVIDKLMEGEKQYSQKRDYSWLIPCIVNPRTNYVQSNMYCSIINIVSFLPNILDFLVESITIPGLLDSLEFSEDFMLVIVQHLSYKPQLFYDLIDQIVTRLGSQESKKDQTRSLLNVLSRCIDNMCNINNDLLHQKNQGYLSQFINISNSLAQTETLSQKLFERLSHYKLKTFLNVIGCLQYKLRIYESVRVYPKAETMSRRNIANSEEIFSRKHDPEVLKKQDVTIIPVSFQTSGSACQIADKKLDTNYLFWFQFKSQLDFNRKVNQIIKSPYQDVEYDMNANKWQPLQNQQEMGESQHNEQKKQQQKQQHYQVIQKQETPQSITPQNISQPTEQQGNKPQEEKEQEVVQKKKEKEEPIEQPEDTVLYERIEYHKTSDLPIKEYIKYLNIDRDEFFDFGDDDEYLRMKLEEVLRAKRRELKKIMIASEYLLVNGEEYKVDLKAQETMINEEIKTLHQLNFKEFSILREDQVLKHLDLTHEAMKIINERQDQQEDIPSPPPLGQNQNFNLEQANPPQQSNETQVSEQPKQVQKQESQQPPAKVEKEQKQQTPPPQQQDKERETKDQTKPLMQIVSEYCSKRQKEFQDKTYRADKAVDNIIKSIQLYSNTHQLSDEVICYYLYELLNEQGDDKHDYNYAVSGISNYLRLANLAMRVAADILMRTAIFPPGLFGIRGSVPIVHANRALEVFDKLQRLYTYLFIDTNSEEFHLATYKSEDYSFVQQHTPIKFNPIKIFPLPEKNVELVRLLEQVVDHPDVQFRKLSGLFEALIPLLDKYMNKSTILFKKQEGNVFDMLSESVVAFSKKSPRFLSAVANSIYVLDQIPFIDKKMSVFGGLLDVCIDTTISMNQHGIQRLKYLKEQNNTQLNKYNVFQRRENEIEMFKDGQKLNLLFDSITGNEWWSNQIFMDAYQKRIADVIQTMLKYMTLQVSETNPKLNYEFQMGNLQKIVLQKRAKELLLFLKDNEQSVQNALQFNRQPTNKPVNTPQLNSIDKMLIDFIQQNGPDIVNQSSCIFSLHPEVMKYYNKNLKSTLWRRFISGQSCPQLEIKVERDQVVFSTFKELQKKENQKLFESELEIKFQNQIGIDGGGLMSQYAQLFFAELEDCRTGLFQATKLGFLVPSRFSSKVLYSKKIFRSIGQILGKCVCQNLMSSSFNLDRYIIKLLYGEPVGSLDDIKHADEQLHRNFSWILQNDVSDLEMTFEVPDEFLDVVSTKELIENAKSTPVTNQNKRDYVDRYIHWILIGSIEPQLRQLLTGFYQTCPVAHVRTLYSTLQELEKYICGDIQFDIELCKKQIQLKQCSLSTSQIIWLFEILGEMNKEEIQAFLVFVTGRKRLPWNKFEPFTISLTQSVNTLPSSNTCSYKLNLGLYQSKQMERAKLMLAISQTKGFHNY